MSFQQPADFVDILNNVRDILVFKSATGTLALSENNVLLTVAGSNLTLTLPPVSQAIGMVFNIEVDETGAGNGIVADANDAVGWSDLTSSADGYLVLLCTGRRWITLASSNFA